MRHTITILVLSFFICLAFLNSPEQLKDHNSHNALAQEGMVLGVSEQAGSLKLSDLIKTKNSLPDNIEKKPINEPIRIDNNDFEIAHGHALAMDVDSEAVLFEKDSDIPVPIASISKLMTALVALDLIEDWDKYYQVKADEYTNGGRIYLSPGEQAKVNDLLFLMLIGSANTATRALVGATGREEAEFVELMNKKADSLGLRQATFVDPIGLSHKNVATAREVAMLMKAAMQSDMIRAAVKMKEHRFNTLSGKSRLVRSTNNILSYNFPDNIEANGGKTGYTALAGYCLTGEFEQDDQHRVITVVLGMSENPARFKITRNLVDWVYKNYQWEE